MSIAAELERDAKRRGVLADPQRWIYCQAQGPKRQPCWRRPVIGGRICAECWRAMQRRVR